MSLKDSVDTILRSRDLIAWRPPAVYAIGAHIIFTITGGPIWARSLVARAITAIDPLAAGTTATMTFGGVATDAGAAIASAAGTLILFPLDVAAINSPIPNVAAGQDAAWTLMAAPGNVVCTIGVAGTVGTIEFFLVYQKLHLASNVV